MTANSFDARTELELAGRRFEIYRLDALTKRGFDIERLPFSLKVLLENLLRTEGNGSVSAADIEALCGWEASAAPSVEIAFSPARVLLQDFTGVPAVVDLAAMRDAMAEMGGDGSAITPLVPAELVIDHSVQVDVFGTRDAFARNAAREFERNAERYSFLRWGQGAFDNFAVVPPDTGIVHQVNLEYLARVVFVAERAGQLPQAYPDTLIGTDSHTTMVNGLGVLGWGVGGIEAEAAMLGQPMSMLLPQVIGFRLSGELPEGATATDLVLTVTEMLRHKGVVGRFVEFFGDGLARLPIADRATIGNMSPEFGSTAAIFPIDSETLRYLRFTGRPSESVELVEAYAREQGLWHDESSAEPVYSDTLELDLGAVEPSLAGPRRPQDRVPLHSSRERFREALATFVPEGDATANGGGANGGGGGTAVATRELCHGDVVIAAITSCTNTSNPAVMVAAGLLAKAAVEAGLERKPWVKTSLAPGSRVVTEYLDRAGLTEPLEQLGFNLVGYGCTTCIGNSGPLEEEVSAAIAERDLAVAAVLSGNRNFEGRIQSEVKLNYLASPPLVVAYALAGTMDIDLAGEPLGEGSDGEAIYLRDLWPSSEDIARTVESAVQSDMFRKSYAEVFDGDENWHSLDVPSGDRYDWRESTYVRRPPFFDSLPPQPPAPADISGARALAVLGDSVTTDHISPAGAIKRDSPAGRYLLENGVEFAEFNSYGARRGNHEVMVRGTFANIRLRNLLGGPGLPEGGFTRHVSGGEEMTIYDAAVRYGKEGVPLVVLGGKEYGSGSSRDWAAKGTLLLGVRAVIAESFERIHRTNLVGMGLLPLQFSDGDSVASLGLSGEEEYSVSGIAEPIAAGRRPETATVTADGRSFEVVVRIDTPMEVNYYRHGGILPYVLRQLLAAG
ncbi:MAG TPA: aconitate hydratase AcnA [Solirubrobacteraceae bacterium]|jgi:aconitate hydratase|nr:aconitate hydratase AcnA [Solirubrobacteraceae bacterium]